MGFKLRILGLILIIAGGAAFYLEMLDWMIAGGIIVVGLLLLLFGGGKRNHEKEHQKIMNKIMVLNAEASRLPIGSAEKIKVENEIDYLMKEGKKIEQSLKDEMIIEEYKKRHP